MEVLHVSGLIHRCSDVSHSDSVVGSIIGRRVVGHGLCTVIGR